MTIGGLIDRYRSKIERRFNRRTEEVEAVYDEDLWRILEALDLLDALDSGTLRCAITGALLTRDNVGGVMITPQGPKLIADARLADRTLGAVSP